jgi:hypothetical protein
VTAKRGGPSVVGEELYPNPVLTSIHAVFRHWSADHLNRSVILSAAVFHASEASPTLRLAGVSQTAPQCIFGNQPWRFTPFLSVREQAAKQNEGLALCAVFGYRRATGEGF